MSELLCVLTAAAIVAAAVMFLLLWWRYRQWEAEQIRRAQEWQKRSKELLEELRKDIQKGDRRNG